MANIVMLEALTENMRVLLQVFNKDKVEITNETIHKDILSWGNSTQLQNHYRGGVRWVVKMNGGNYHKLPTDWLDMSVQQVAEYLISKQAI